MAWGSRMWRCFSNVWWPRRRHGGSNKMYAWRRGWGPGDAGFMTEQGVFSGEESDDALSSLPIEVLGLADGVLFKSSDHSDPAVREIGRLGQALFVGNEGRAGGQDLPVAAVHRFGDGRSAQAGRKRRGSRRVHRMAPQLGRGPGGLVAWDVNQRRPCSTRTRDPHQDTACDGLSGYAGLETFLGALRSDGGLASRKPGTSVMRRAARSCGAERT